MTAVVRYLFALLVGVLVGAGGTVYLVNSGTGDLFVQKTEVVQDLKRRLSEVETQRNQLNKQLEDVVARSERMERQFDELAGRFKGLAEERGAAVPPPSGPQAPAQTP
jgi:Tfp pilus assembly protein PilO